MPADARPTHVGPGAEPVPPDDAAPPGPLRVWLARWGGPLATLLVLAVALVVLRGELAGTRYHALMRAARAVPPAQVALAGALTAIAYAVLSGYDALALAYVRRHPDVRATDARPPAVRLALPRVMATSALAYAVSQTLGFAALTGNAVRYRFWSAWGLSPVEVTQAAGFVAATFTAGLATVCGLALAFEPARELSLLGTPPLAGRLVGALLLTASAAYVAWSAARRGRPVRIRGWAFPVPGPGFATLQLALALVDWAVSASVLWVLLPPTPGLGFLPFVGAFTIAQCAGILSHVPGGLGVFETLLVWLLSPWLSAGQALGTALVYRAVYYLAPFALAVAALGLTEARRQRERLAAVAQRAGAAAGGTGAVLARVGPAVLPAALGALTFLAGAVLLFSGATPSVHHRVRALAGAVPLPVIELSHFAASVLGVALLVLAWATRRRLDAAYGLTVAALALGIAASLLKGLDWEEAALLALVLAAVLPARRVFYRRAALTSEPLTPAWVVAVLAVVGASVWLGFFSYQHVEYRDDLWWRFAVRGDAPRFLRATAGAVGAVGMLGLVRLLRPATAEPELPTAAELARAAAVVARVPESTAHVALLGDKALLFAEGAAAGAGDTASDDAPNGAGDGFVMYGVAGRSWVAMGDPVGPPARRAELAWRFKSEADRHGAWPVFYQVGADSLPLYIDLGLAFMKLGEEAHVPLRGFTLDGGSRKWMRRALKDGDKLGWAFEVVPAAAVPALIPALRAVSDDWLGGKAAREKGFSLGRFDAAYLARTPAALVRDAAGEVVAFANLWLGAPGSECAPDLMRHRHDARGAMDYLFVALLRWGSAEGYARCNLGMAPLAGLEARRLAPLWARAGALVARRGEPFYNFQGLRAYKQKFDPVWEPRYLASPGGLVLPRVLANVATLVAGGLSGVVRK